MKEIRFHGRGGQGAVLASVILVKAFTKEKRYSSAIPYFGFERRGAPVTAFLRVDDRPLREKTQIYSPDCVVVMDPTLKRSSEIFQGLKDGGIVVLSTRKPVEEMDIPSGVGTLGCVDAIGISLEILGSPITNSCMLGAFVATTGWLSLGSVLESIRETWSGETGEKNLRAAEAGYNRAKVVRLRWNDGGSGGVSGRVPHL
jgi:2-oxoacid:acceptor oxidoreductase gamma subunit (pyruvate/2-ketoisovalerate family)